MIQHGQEFTPPPWLALGFERPTPAKGCDQGCQPSDIGTVDVYCERHGRFLPGTPGRPRTVLLHVLRAAFCLAFWAAATSNMPIFLYLAGVAVAAAVLTLPLRRLRSALWTTVIVWCSVSLMIGLSGSGQAMSPQIMVVALAALTFASTVHSAGLAWIGGPDRIRRTGGTAGHHTVPTMSGPVAAFTAVGAILASAAWATTRWAPGFQFEPLLLGLAATCLVAAAFTTVVSAMVESGSHIDRTVTNLVRPPERPTPLGELMRAHHSRVGPARDVFDHIGNAFAIFLVRASYVTRLMLFAALMALCATVNLLHAWLVRLGRRMVATLRLSLSVVGHAFLIGVKSTLHSIRVLLVPLAMMIAAAALISAWADAALHYSTSGSLVSLGLLGVEAAGALAFLFTSWILLAGQPVGAAFLSSIRTLSIAGANGLILLAAGGWVLGGLGLATGGPIQVGWLTVGATFVLVVATFRSRARARRPVTLPVNKAIL